MAQSPTTKEAIFAGGCFWCVESSFDDQEGVLETISGYTGGSEGTANYQAIGTGKSGHVEALKVVYDPEQVEYETLVQTFWESIDPTDDGGQFADRGEQYRTVIFVKNEEERAIAERTKQATERYLGKPVVTRILEAKPFYPAEEYHQDYHKKNPERYKRYYYGSGRASKINELWGDKR